MNFKGVITIEKESLLVASPFIIGALILSFLSPPIAVFVGIFAGIVLMKVNIVGEKTVPIEKVVEVFNYVEPTRPEPVWEPPPEVVNISTDDNEPNVPAPVTAVPKKKKPRPPFIVVDVDPPEPMPKKPVKKH